MIAIQVSLYPLQQADIEPALEEFWKVLKQEEIKHRITPLSTVIWSEDEEHLYNAVFTAYKKAREKGSAVMVQTLITAEKKRVDELLSYLDI
jgi:uncharacterized protein YqgV (UPF0045/DUF77 family)